MSIFKRIGDMIRANINDLLDRAEDPEKMLKQMILDMEESVREGKVALAQAIAQGNILKAQYEEQSKKAQEWYQKAEFALARGDEGLARECLNRKKNADQAAQAAKAQLEEHEKAVAQARMDLDALEGKVSQARERMQLLIARQRSAEASKKVNEQLAGISRETSAFDTFDRMESKIERLEAEARAAKMVQSDSLEERLAKLGADQEVEDELAALKAKLEQKKAGSGQ